MGDVKEDGAQSVKRGFVCVSPLPHSLPNGRQLGPFGGGGGGGSSAHIGGRGDC